MREAEWEWGAQLTPCKTGCRTFSGADLLGGSAKITDPTFR